MARKPIQRSLLPLATQVQGFKGLTSRDHKRHTLCEMLRQIAIRNRRRRPHPFYSMREVAKFSRSHSPRWERLQTTRTRRTFAAAAQFHDRTGSRGAPRPAGLRARGGGADLLCRDFSCCAIAIVLHPIEQELRQRNFVANLIFTAMGNRWSLNSLDRVLLHEPEFLTGFVRLR